LRGKLVAMGDAELWAAVIGLETLVAVLLVALLLDGSYQVMTGRPSRIPLERLLFHRVPATELDCIRQGAFKLLQSTALLLTQVPSGFILIRTTADLTGLMPPPFGRLPAPLEALMFGAIFGSLGLSLVVIGLAYRVSLKVKFRSVETEAPAL
jgi:hypothetical protein